MTTSASTVQAISPGIGLGDVIRPLTISTFMSDFWDRGEPFLSQPDTSLVERVRSIPALATPEALLGKHQGPVKLLGPNAFRSSVPANVAMDFLSAGYNLYIGDIERTLPEAAALVANVAKDLGFAPWQLRIEAFAGKAGGVSSRHYDHDVNLQILIEGTKDWVLERNRNIINPNRPYHPGHRSRGKENNFHEEAYAHDPAIPESFDVERCTRRRATAGTVLFLPRGHWHEVTSLDDTWSLNVVVVGLTWAGSMCRMLETLLLQDPRFREYCGGIAFDERPHLKRRVPRDEALFDQMRTRAISVLQRMTSQDAALAGAGSRRFRWHTSAGDRRVEEKDGEWCLKAPGVLAEPLDLDRTVVPALHELCALRGPFDWTQAMCAAQAISAVELWNLLADLIHLRLIERSN